MARKPKAVPIQFQGRSCQGVQIEIEESTVRSSTIKLADGTIIDIKVVAAEAFRLEEADKDGKPIYVIKSANVMSVDIPDELLQDKGETH
jgi:hypothetical protein